MIAHQYLFNFSASYSGGGFKRLYAYAKWFHQQGGARFIINARCSLLMNQFPNNHFIIVSPSRVERFFNDGAYLRSICNEFGVPAFYYSYGIPVYYKVGQINWFHLSNVLPLSAEKLHLSVFDLMKANVLGKKINDNFKHADIISAESDFSLNLIRSNDEIKKFLSVNGADDELAACNTLPSEQTENTAIVVGTYRYKAIHDSYHVFEMLRERNNGLKLVLIGDEKRIPQRLRVNENIRITGRLEQGAVVEYLRNAKYYISTTYIENSYNAASEGAFLAQESFISDIGPHREMIADMPCEEVSVPNVQRSLLHIKRVALSTRHLKTWDNVITEMLGRVHGGL